MAIGLIDYQYNNVRDPVWVLWIKVAKLQKSYIHMSTFKSWKEGQGDSLSGYFIEEENFPRIATFSNFLAKSE